MSKNVLYSSVFFSLACFTCLSYADEAVQPEMGPHPMRVSVRHIEGKGIGYNDGYTSLTGFFAPNPEGLPVLPFADVRGHVFDDGKFATNVGFGLRGILGDCWVFGGNTYYDFRHTKHHNYNQVSVGFEALHPRWEVRANGYLPVGRKTSKLFDKNETTATTFNSFSGHNALLNNCITKTGKMEYAMKGVDSEVGFHLFRSKDYDVFVGAGPYYFNFDEKNAIGGKVRAAVRIFEYVTLEAMNSYDTRFKEIIQGQISVNIPFGPRDDLSKSKTFAKSDKAYLLNQRMIQDVARQEIVVVDRKRKTEQCCSVATALDPSSGNPWVFYFVNNTSHSDGTFESPYPTLYQAQNASSPNDIIYVYAGDGTYNGMIDGIVLKDNQRLLGASTPHGLNTQFGNVVIPPQSNVMPYITNFTNINNNDGDVVTIANNNEVSGLNIFAYPFGNNGIATPFKFPGFLNNLNVNNNVFEVLSNSAGVFLTEVTGSVSISNNLFNLGRELSPDTSEGIFVGNTLVHNAAYSITNNTMTGGFAGIEMHFTNCTNFLTNISGNILNTGFDNPGIAIDLNSTVVVASNAEPVFFIENNKIVSEGPFGPNVGIFLTNEASASFNISYNQLYVSGADNIDIESDRRSSGNFVISSNEMFGLTDSAFLGPLASNVNLFLNDLSFSNVTITNNYMDGDTGNVYAFFGSTRFVPNPQPQANFLIASNNFTSAFG